MRAQVRALHRFARPPVSLGASEEREYMAQLRRSLYAPPIRDARAALNRRIEARSAALRQEIQQQIRAAVSGDQSRAVARVAALGGRVKARIDTENALHVALPAAHLAGLLREPWVARVVESRPMKWELDTTRRSLGVDEFWNMGFTGGIWDAGLIDTGVKTTHPALAGVRFLVHGSGATDSQNHGTGVAGIITSRDTQFRGMAPGLDALLVSRPANDAEVIVQADWMVSMAGDDPEALNLSGGAGRVNDADYNSLDQFFDGLVDDRNVVVVKSAGNDGGQGATSLTHPASAFNVITVGEMDDRGTSNVADDRITDCRSRSQCSSLGPTLNGRQKPDLVAPGANITTLNRDWESLLPDFKSMSGSSASAPHVTGGAILVTDLRGIDSPIATKAVLINNADAWSDGGTPGNNADDGPSTSAPWNSSYGWGQLDLAGAAFHATDVFDGLVDDGFDPPGPDFQLFRGTMLFGDNATLVWNRHVGYNGSNLPTAIDPLTDLDLVAFNANSGSRIVGSESGINNVEQVRLLEGAAEVVLKVDVFGSVHPNVGVEPFALATEEGFTMATPPRFTFTTAVSTPNRFGRTLTISVRNDGAVTAFANQLTVSGFFAGSASLGAIRPGETRAASFSANCPVNGGTFLTSSFTNSSFSYEESFTGSGSVTISCGSGL